MEISKMENENSWLEAYKCPLCDDIMHIVMGLRFDPSYQGLICFNCGHCEPEVLHKQRNIKDQPSTPKVMK